MLGYVLTDMHIIRLLVCYKTQFCFESLLASCQILLLALMGVGGIIMGIPSSKTAIDVCCFTSMIFGAYTTFFSRDEFEIRCIKLEPTRNKIPQPFHLLHASKILVITLAFGNDICMVLSSGIIVPCFSCLH